MRMRHGCRFVVAAVVAVALPLACGGKVASERRAPAGDAGGISTGGATTTPGGDEGAGAAGGSLGILIPPSVIF
ncbi:MAG TPA: hypothetical protein PLU22_23580, partial [Polyangiaceae bacterium]|nr:hypothetical protein [Polyangiaceae bacterium]